MDTRAKQMVERFNYKGHEVKIVQTQGYSAKLIAISNQGVPEKDFHAFGGEGRRLAEEYIDNLQ